MRTVHPAAQILREKRSGIAERDCVRISARHRSTGAIESVELWSGLQNEVINVPIDGVTVPTFFTGAGPILGISDVIYEAGLQIRPTTITLATNHPQVVDAIRAYDPQGAPVTVWKRTMDPVTMKEVGIEVWFKGLVNGSPVSSSGEGGETSIELQIVSLMRMGTLTSHRQKSDQEQKQRNGCRIRKYRSNKFDTMWGPQND